MKNLYCLILFCIITLSLYAQPLTGTKTIKSSGGNYSTIAAAISDLNTNGAGTGGVTFNIDAGFTETASNLTITTTTGSASNPIVFQKSGSGANPLITASTGASTSVDGIIRIAGADYITFDHIDLQENSSNTTPTTQMEWGFAVLLGSATNGSQHIVIKNCNISLNKNYSSSVGIYSYNHNTTVTTPISVTSTTGANSYNKYYGNNISNVYTGIYLSGYADPTSPYSYFDQNNEIGTDGANIITNFGSAASYSVYGIYISYQNNCKIANNKIISGSGITNYVYGIYGSSGSLANADYYSNFISLGSAGTTSYIYGIYNGIGATGSSNSVNIYNNIIRNCSYSVSSSGNIYGIYNNTNPGTINIYKNTIDTISTSGSGYIYCIHNNGQSNQVFIDSNEINNISHTGTGSIYGIYQYYTATSGIEKIFSNNLHHFSVSTAYNIYGIYSYPVTTTKKQIYLNNVYTFSSGGGYIYGFYQQSGDSIRLYRNKFYDYSSTASTGIVQAIYLSSGTNMFVYNNFVSDLRTPASASSNAINGIYISSATYTGIYYNTILLNSSSSSSTFGSACIYNVSTTQFDLRNNILVNKSTPGSSSGYSTVLYYSSYTSAYYTNSSNNNCMYAGSSNSKRMIFYNGSAGDTTLQDFKNRVSPRDYSSVTEDVPFINQTTAPFNLHLSASVPTQCESGGSPVNVPFSINLDFDGNTRHATYPDIGADEGSFVINDINPPNISYTPLANTSSTSSRSLTAVITDASGVPVSGSGIPRLYWKKNTGIYNIASASSVTGNQYTFSFGSGVVSGDSILYFVIAQDNASTPNVGSYPNAGASGYTANPPAVANTPTNPSQYKIIPTFAGGDYKIGGTGTTPCSSCSYVDLTAAVAAISNKEITGAVNFILTSSYSSSQEDSFPVVINSVVGASSGKVITIKPDTLVTTSITGSSTTSIIKLNEAHYITIDGSYNGSSNRNLTIENTSTAAYTAAVWIKTLGTGSGCTNIILKNCVIKTGSNSATTFGISAGSNIGYSGDDNDYLTFQNNHIKKANFGILVIANSTGPSNNISILKNIIGDSSSTDNIGLYGIALQTVNTFGIYQNTIKNISVPSINPTAIYISTACHTGSIYKNLIYGIKYTGTSGYGGKGIEINTGSLTSGLNIYNNLLTDISGDGWSTITSDAIVGIRINSGTGGINIYYNTVNLFGNISRSSSADVSAAIYIGAVTGNLDIRNNIFSNTILNTTGTAKAYAIYSDAIASSFYRLNYNGYYSSGTQGFLGRFSATDYSTIAAWRTYSLQDTQSVFTNPLFVSNYDLHPNSTVLNNAAIPIGMVTDDYSGSTRSSTPDIGAYEFAVKPTAITQSASSVSGYTATMNGIVNANGNTANVSFNFGLTTAYGTNVTATPSTASGSANTNVSAIISGLVPNTTYHYRVSATNSNGTANGADSTFTTSLMAPVANTDSSGSITISSGKIYGIVNANNASTTVSFEYDTNKTYSKSIAATPSPVTGISNTLCSATLNSLQPNTKYFYRVKAINAKGTTLGKDSSFKTMARTADAITDGANVFSSTTAKLNGRVNAYNASTTVTFEYGLTTSYGSSVTATQSPVNGNTLVPVSFTVTTLTFNTTYHYRIVATNSAGTIYGHDTTFNTSSIVATATTKGATFVTHNTATMNGIVNANTTTSQVNFQYGTNTSYGTTVLANPDTVTGNTNTPVSYNLSGLIPNTTYHYRVLAKNAVGSSNGNDTFFKTNKITPVAITNSAGSITTTSAIIKGTVNANNSLTNVSFQYGLTTAYGNTVNAVPDTVNGIINKSVSQTLSGLLANTTYHYRVVAVNAAGTTNGADSIFTTLPEKSLATTDTVKLYGATYATLRGIVNARNTPTAVIFEFGLTTAYGNIIAGNPDTVKGSTNTNITGFVSGLIPHKLYHYRVAGINKGGTTNGSDMTFTTKDTLATVTTAAITNIAVKTAKGGGNVTSDGGAAITTRGICWNTATKPTITNDRSIDGSGIGAFSSNLFALTHTTKYYVRAYAINAVGTVYGNEVTFSTISSIDEHLQNGSIRLYSDMNRIFVKVSLNIPGNHKLMIYDLTGHLLTEKTVRNDVEEVIDMDLSHTSAVYLVQIITSDGQLFRDKIFIR
jgi:phosphodiesterase/alkaline phosphatase D-like protein